MPCDAKNLRKIFVRSAGILTIVAAFIIGGFKVYQSDFVADLNTKYANRTLFKNIGYLNPKMGLEEVRRILGEEMLVYKTGMYPTCLGYSSRRSQWANFKHLAVCFDKEDKYAATLEYVF